MLMKLTIINNIGTYNNICHLQIQLDINLICQIYDDIVN